MIDILISALGMSGIMLLVNAALTWPGMLADKINVRRGRRISLPNNGTGVIMPKTLMEYLEEVPELISKPLYDCIICMSPWWAIGLGWPIFFGSWTPTENSLTFFGIVVWINVIVDTFVLAKREGI